MESDSSHTIEVTVEAQAWHAAVTDPDQHCRRVVAAVLAREPDLAHRTAEVSVLLTDDRRVRELNRAYRGKDKATNVLSFPADEAPHGSVPDYPRLLGDIVVAFETTEREAQAEDKSVRDHLAHLVVHGTLHLLGHDHEDDAQALAMEALEVEVLAALGIADPYRGEAAA